MKKILVLDNYDSFTYNLVHIVESYDVEVDVFRNDKIALDAVGVYDKIILSPGPGIPEEAGILLPLIKQYAATKSILGVCLGHQAIGQVFGANLINMKDVIHGKPSQNIVLKEDYIFEGLPKQHEVGRYHSWVLEADTVKQPLEVISVDENKLVMAIRHTKYDVRGVQFHPESVMTPEGKKMMHNWLFKSR